MDLEYNGGKDLAEQLCKVYLRHSGEDDNDLIYQLIKSYKVYRAYVRGKVTSFILKDLNLSDDKKTEARNTAQKYFALAHSYI
jgi:aminoglycoside phosphotransferase family enzyme